MEKIGLVGVLELKFFVNGIFKETIKSKNLIVNSGYLALFSALSGTLNSIVGVKCGSDGTTPSESDTSITDAVNLPVTSITPTAAQLTIVFELGSETANGLTISEFGTICEDGTLFSRINWTPFLKNDAISVTGTWTISKS